MTSRGALCETQLEGWSRRGPGDDEGPVFGATQLVFTCMIPHPLKNGVGEEGAENDPWRAPFTVPTYAFVGEMEFGDPLPLPTRPLRDP